MVESQTSQRPVTRTYRSVLVRLLPLPSEVPLEHSAPILERLVIRYSPICRSPEFETRVAGVRLGSSNSLEDHRMFAHTFMITLASFMLSAASESPSWETDYASALRLGRKGSQPLAVFVGRGKEGWNQVSQEGELGKEVKRMLAKNYICVYLDTELQAGRQLARDFEIPKGLGLVVSDHTGGIQAFHHQGDLPNQQLVHYLGKFADPHRVVRATETNSAEPERSYPADPVAAQPNYQPSYYSPMYVGRSGSC